MEKLVPKLRFPEFNVNWEKKKISEISKISRGKSKHRPRNASILYGGKYPFIQTGDIREADLYITSYNQTYSEEGLKQSKLWDENTLCITIAANIAETAILKIKACFPDSIIGLIPFEDKSNVYFIKYQFDKFKIDIQKLSQGVAQDNLNQEKLSNIIFNIPSLPEQQKIASFLTSVDERLTLLSQQKEKLELYKKGVMQQIFSQKLRFKDENGKDYADWEEKKLGEITKITTGKLDANAMVENGEYRFYTCAKEYYKIDNYAFDTEALLISGNGANVGYIHYYKGKFNAYQRTYVLFNVTESYFYLKYYLDCHLLKRIHREKKDGNTPYIVLNTLTDMKIDIPCLEEQQKIASFLSAIDVQIEGVSMKIEQTKIFKKGLLQQLFV